MGYRLDADNILDQIENEVRDILEELQKEENRIHMDPEIMDHSEIMLLQGAVEEAITSLKDLADRLY